MILKEKVLKRCECCNAYEGIISETVYGCDNCNKEFSGGKLQLTIHMAGSDYEEKEFCCWKCVFEFIPTIKCNYFVSLPFLHFDKQAKGLGVKDFVKCLH